MRSLIFLSLIVVLQISQSIAQNQTVDEKPLVDGSSGQTNVATSYQETDASNRSATDDKGRPSSAVPNGILDDFEPAPTNQSGKDYPQVNSQGRIKFRIVAPDAKSVSTTFRESTQFVKGDDGAWIGYSRPLDEGFHYYELVIDGANVPDPNSKYYFGAMRWGSGIEIPAHDRDFYALKHVPHGQIREIYFHSDSTKSERRAFVYTPPEYDRDQDVRYPVLYLQHGWGENEYGWSDQGHAALIMDNLLAEGTAKPFIIVMTYGMTNEVRRGGLQNFDIKDFEKVLVDELVPHVDKNFRTLSDQPNRAMAGLSMGSMETKSITLRNLDKFSHIGLFSGATIGTTDVENTEGFHDKVKLVFVSYGSKEVDGSDGRRRADPADSVKQLRDMGINAHYYQSKGTAHEWQSWRRSLKEFAPLLFQPASNVLGTWKVDFETRVGIQPYVIKIERQGDRWVASAKAELNGQTREVTFQNLQTDGGNISFAEIFSVDGNDIRIQYNGKVVDNAIEFSRKVADFADEQAKATRLVDSAQAEIVESATTAVDGASIQPQQPVTMANLVDPNFHIYLCFGQSNMESGGRMDNADLDVDKRFLVMADFDNTERGWKKGSWYQAIPPLAARGRGICMVDAFGKSLVKSLSHEVRVGVIKVCVPGCKIELFQKDSFQSYIADQQDWMKNIVLGYEDNPYQYLVDMAKEAQKHGVIKGILLHQGESNSGDKEWPIKVKSVYDSLMIDLNLKADDVPLLAGEVVHSDQEGKCAGFNDILRQLPQAISTAHIISSAGCTTDDKLHFNSAGSRLLGSRYAETMLSLLEAKTNVMNSLIAQRNEQTEDSLALDEVIDGTWHSQFETPFGVQTYRFSFNTKNRAPSITATVETGNERRDVEFIDVKVDGKTFSFAEVRKINDRELRIEYSGKLEDKKMVLARSFGNRDVQEVLATRHTPKPPEVTSTEPVVDVKIDRIIKDAFRDSFLIGMAGDVPTRYSDEELSLAATHFGAITPENCMKPERIHPGEFDWQFEPSDALVDWAEKNGMTAHGHTLVWHQQTPNWFFQGGDRQIITQRLKEHIVTLVSRYKGRLQSWDVVNEAINDGGNPETAKTENLRDSQWLQALGPELLSLAFKLAHEADPKAVLYYNDYNIESGPKHESSMVLLRRLLADGAPVHAVGIQGHWRTGQIPYEDIDKAIANYASLGLKVAITELDVTIRGESGGQFGRGFGRNPSRGPASIDAEDLHEQAEAYAKLFAILKKHENVIERVTFWGLNDRRTWRWGQHPLLFDAHNHPKPAYAAVVAEATEGETGATRGQSSPID